jgi:hypothetical protein
MKNTAKLAAVCIFALGALFVFLSSGLSSFAGTSVSLQPTPPKNTNAANAAANTKSSVTNAPANLAANAPSSAPSSSANTGTAAAGSKKIEPNFTLGTDSLDAEKGEVAFNHEHHAFLKYSPDGTKVMGCVECHHTDQPKSTAHPTSERDEVLTIDVFQKSNQKVSKCRDCHFQAGNVPEGKTMPKANGKDMDNQLAYHINCNNCHDEAFKARPSLKATNKTFATAKDCLVCHKLVTN